MKTFNTEDEYWNSIKADAKKNIINYSNGETKTLIDEECPFELFYECLFELVRDGYITICPGPECWGYDVRVHIEERHKINSARDTISYSVGIPMASKKLKDTILKLLCGEK